jgi:beta-glucosidase
VYYSHKPSGGRSHWLGDYVEESTKPLFPFGFGLSYTTFESEGLWLSRRTVSPRESVDVELTVSNSGSRSGAEVVQLYVRYRGASVTRPVKELKGFCRISLEPGVGRRVRFRLDPKTLAFLDREKRWVVESGTVEVMVGSSSADIRVTGSFDIVGEPYHLQNRESFFNEPMVQRLE